MDNSFTMEDYNRLSKIILKSQNDDYWDDSEVLKSDEYVISQFQGTAFDSDYQCFQVCKENAEGKIVVKRTNETENTVTKILNNIPENYIGISTPFNIAAAKLKTTNDKNILLFEDSIDGKEIYQSKDKSLWGKVGLALGKFHDYFWQNNHNNLLAEWISMIENEKIEDRRVNLERKIQNAAVRTKGNRYFSEILEYSIINIRNIPRVFSHGDLFPTNILVDDKKVWFIDWADTAVLPYIMDLARLTCLPRMDGTDMCPYDDIVAENYYKTISGKSDISHEKFVQDLYTAQFIELANIYYPPSRLSVHYQSKLNQRTEKKMYELVEKIRINREKE